MKLLWRFGCLKCSGAGFCEHLPQILIELPEHRAGAHFIQQLHDPLNLSAAKKMVPRSLSSVATSSSGFTTPLLFGSTVGLPVERRRRGLISPGG
jgi:hypothetical protein